MHKMSNLKKKTTTCNLSQSVIFYCLCLCWIIQIVARIEFCFIMWTQKCIPEIGHVTDRKQEKQHIYLHIFSSVSAEWVPHNWSG